ncbi:MAG: Crp/Fnr family transcriptional regulator [Cyclobacteriaceae bacterium]
MIKADCHSCNNNHCLIKKHVHEIDKKGYLDQKNTLTCKKTQNFLLEGAPLQGLFFIYSGSVKVFKTGINGKEQIIRFSNDGDIIGHRGFGAGQSYQISAVAVADTVLCNFSNHVLEDMLKKIPNLTYSLMTFYAEELSRSESKMKKIAQMSVREKVIDTLLYFNRKYGQKEGFLDIKLSRKEIADFAGTTDEQVIRVLSALKKESLIQTEGKKIGIPNLQLFKQQIAEHNFFLDS